MALRCGLGLHEAAPRQVWNDTFYFSHCTRCNCQLIRRSGLWKPVPRGYRVVWKDRSADAFDVSSWTDGCAPHDAELAAFKGRNWA